MRVARRSIEMAITPPPSGFREVIFIETGCGTDQHGQDVTKACVRACKGGGYLYELEDPLQVVKLPPAREQRDPSLACRNVGTNHIHTERAGEREGETKQGEIER